MQEMGETAQERLQMQSLRNVRALVDKLEGEQRTSPRLGYAIALVVGLLAIGIGGIVLVRYNLPRAVEARRIAAVDVAALSRDQFEDHVVARLNFVGNGPELEAMRTSGTSGRGVVHLTLQQRKAPEVALVKSSGDSQLDGRLLTLARYGAMNVLPASLQGAPFEIDLAMALEPGRFSATRLPKA